MPDYGIASRIVAPKSDPLEMAGKLQTLAGSSLQNRILGFSLGSKTSGGRAMGASIDPSSGLPDPALVGKYFAAHPDEAQFAPDAIKDAQALRTGQLGNQGTQITNDTNALNLTLKKLDAATGVLDSALTDKAPFTQDRLISTVRGVIQQGHFTGDQHAMQMATQVLTDAPQPTGDQAADDRAMREYVQKISLQFRNSQEHINTLLGGTQNIDTGPSVLTERAGGIGPNGMQVVGKTEKGLSPGEAVTPNFNVVAPDGTPGVVTKGATAAAAASGAPPAVIPTGQPAGRVEALAGAQKASQEQFTADTNDAGGFAQRMQGLNNAEKALAKAQTGKGGQAVQDWKAIVNTIAPGMLSEADKTKAVNFDEAKKYLTDYANRRGAALGMGTDAGREMIHAANPSVDINKAAAQDILKVIKGLERMQNAQVAAAQAAGINPGDYATWRAGWNRNIAPAGFMADQIPAAKRAKEFDAMSKPEQAKYARAVKAAIDAGYFTADDLRK